jgi:hypothetical protein
MTMLAGADDGAGPARAGLARRRGLTFGDAG